MSKILQDLSVIVLNANPNAQKWFLYTSVDPKTKIFKAYIGSLYSGSFKIPSTVEDSAIDDRIKEIISEAKGET